MTKNNRQHIYLTDRYKAMLTELCEHYGDTANNVIKELIYERHLKLTPKATQNEKAAK